MRPTLFALLPCFFLLACGQPATDPLPDGSEGHDAAVTGDAGGSTDAGSPRDAATGHDGGASNDAGTVMPPEDAGTVMPPEDAGTTPPPAPTSPCPADITSDPRVMQALPSIDLDTTYPAQAGRTVHVAAGDDLQAAIDQAQPGDTLELAPDATFTGPFHLRAKTGEGWVVIRTATPDAMLPPPGTRVRPSDAALLPDLVVPAGQGGVFVTDHGAHHYRLTGLEIRPVAGEFVTALVELGGSETSLDQLPHHLVIDRSYLHADPAVGGRRGVALNSGAAAVIDSWLEGFFQSGSDSQAIAGWLGTGPYRIWNNHLEGASENVLFGGGDPRIADVVTSDIEVCGNHFYKPRTWIGAHRVVKNLFELKNARRVLVAGNVLENNWQDGQSGMAVVFTPRNQDGTAPWCTVEDVTFARNVLRGTSGGVNILGEDDLNPSQQTARVVVRDNLLEVDNQTQPGVGRAFQLVTPNRPALGVVIAHNTVRVVGNSAVTMGDSTAVVQDFHLLDNVMEHAAYGIFGGGVGEGNACFAQYAPDADVQGNVLIGYSASRYPAQNFYPADDGAVGFADPTAGDYSLAGSSAYAARGTDGTDPGADFTALARATAAALVAP